MQTLRTERAIFLPFKQIGERPVAKQRRSQLDLSGNKNVHSSKPLFKRPQPNRLLKFEFALKQMRLDCRWRRFKEHKAIAYY